MPNCFSCDKDGVVRVVADDPGTTPGHKVHFDRKEATVVTNWSKLDFILARFKSCNETTGKDTMHGTHIGE